MVWCVVFFYYTIYALTTFFWCCSLSWARTSEMPTLRVYYFYSFCCHQTKYNEMKTETNKASKHQDVKSLLYCFICKWNRWTSVEREMRGGGENEHRLAHVNRSKLIKVSCIIRIVTTEFAFDGGKSKILFCCNFRNSLFQPGPCVYWVSVCHACRVFIYSVAV